MNLSLHISFFIIGFPGDICTMCTLAGRPFTSNACNSSAQSSWLSSNNWHNRAPALDRTSVRLCIVVVVALSFGDCDNLRRNGDDRKSVFLCFGELFGLEWRDVFCLGESGSSSILAVLPPGLYFQPQFFQRFFWSFFRFSFGLAPFSNAPFSCWTSTVATSISSNVNRLWTQVWVFSFYSFVLCFFLTKIFEETLAIRGKKWLSEKTIQRKLGK